MVEKLIDYFKTEINLAEQFNEILADFLGKEATTYSIEPIPSDKVITPYTDGGGLYQFVFNFCSKEFYDESLTQNIENLNFYEKFSDEIEQKNKQKILPDIDGIQSIECLNNGTIENVQEGTAKYAIQMRITYIKN
jgi:hypothetical protein